MSVLSRSRADSAVLAMRREELKHIFEDLRDARDTLANGDDQELKLIRYINSCLRERKLGDLTLSWEKNLNSSEFPDLAKLAPYRYIRRVEEALFPEEPKSKAPFDPAKEMTGFKDTPHTGVADTVLGGIKDLFRSSTPAAKWERLKKEKINAILDSIEKGIKDRQKNMATDLRRWRNDEVQRWTGELAKRRPIGPSTNIPSGRTPQFTGVRYTTY